MVVVMNVLHTVIMIVISRIKLFVKKIRIDCVLERFGELLFI